MKARWDPRLRRISRYDLMFDTVMAGPGSQRIAPPPAPRNELSLETAAMERQTFLRHNLHRDHIETGPQVSAREIASRRISRLAGRTVGSIHRHRASARQPHPSSQTPPRTHTHHDSSALQSADGESADDVFLDKEGHDENGKRDEGGGRGQPAPVQRVV
jgi:hypothetical protein